MITLNKSEAKIVLGSDIEIAEKMSHKKSRLIAFLLSCPTSSSLSTILSFLRKTNSVKEISLKWKKFLVQL